MVPIEQPATNVYSGWVGVRVFRLWWVIGVLVGLGWAPLASAQDFPLDQWLDEPDVKLVAWWAGRWGL